MIKEFNGKLYDVIFSQNMFYFFYKDFILGSIILYNLNTKNIISLKEFIQKVNFCKSCSKKFVKAFKSCSYFGSLFRRKILISWRISFRSNSLARIFCMKICKIAKICKSMLCYIFSKYIYFFFDKDVIRCSITLCNLNTKSLISLEYFIDYSLTFNILIQNNLIIIRVLLSALKWVAYQLK